MVDSVKMPSKIAQGRKQMPSLALRHILLSIFFLLTFRTFQFFPGLKLTREIWVVIALVFLIFPYALWKVRIGWRFYPYELYLLGMILVVPLLAAFSAQKEFGQPIMYGLLAQRGILLAAGGLALLYLLRHKWVGSSDIEKALLISAWGTLFLYLIIMALFDPAQFHGEYLGFASSVYLGKARWQFPVVFIAFGFFYHGFAGFRNRSRTHYFFALVFFLYMLLATGGRSLLVSVLAAFAFFTLRWGSINRLMVFLPRAGIAFFLLLFALYVADANYLVHLYDRFIDAFTVIFTGEQTGDVSANARIFETAIALPYVEKNWLFGSGDISHQWHGGSEAVLGGYFHPSDIGLIGILFEYGSIGILLFAFQFYFVLRFSRIISKKQIQSPLIDATKGFLLYFALHSLVTGMFVHWSEVSFMFIALLGYLAYQARQNERLSDLDGDRQ